MRLRHVGLAGLILSACNSILGNEDHYLVEPTGGANAGEPSAEDSAGGAMDAGGSHQLGSAGSNGGRPIGGASGAGGTPLDPSPEVVDVDPNDLDVDVDVDVNVSVLFSEAMEASTITTDSARVLDGGAPVAGQVSVRDSTATYDPTERLSLAAAYDVSVSSDVTNAAGTPLKAPFTSSFTTRDGVWQVDLPIEDAELGTTTPQVGIDAHGNALVAWGQRTLQSDLEIWARWHRPSGWQQAVKLSDKPANKPPTLAVSAEGDAVVVWTQLKTADEGYDIVTRRYTGGAWNAMPERSTGIIDPATQYVVEGPFAQVRSGHVVLWWSSRADINNNWNNLYAQSATINGAFKPSADRVDFTFYAGITPAFASDASGNGMLIYNAFGEPPGQLQYSTYGVVSDSWQLPSAISNAPPLSSLHFAQLAMNDAGIAMVSWQTGNNLDIFASRYTKAKGFEAPVPLETLDTPSTPAQPGWKSLTTNGTDFLIAWSQRVGSIPNAYAARHDSAAGVWGSAELASDGYARVDALPTCALDPHGNAMVIWWGGTSSSSGYSYTRLLSGSKSWAKPQLLVDGRAYQDLVGIPAVATNGVIAMVSQAASDPQLGTADESFLNVFQ